MPQRSQGRRFEGDEVSFSIAAENEAAGRREHSRPGRRCVLELRLHFTAGWIDRLQKSQVRPSLFRWEVCAAIERMTGLIRLWCRTEDVALIARGHIEQTALRTVSRGHEIRRA